MLRAEFKNMGEFADRLEEILEITERDDIQVVGKYEFISKLFAELVKNEIPISCCVCLESPDWFKYDKEYILTLDDNGVCVEKAFKYGDYIDYLESVIFLHEDCNSKIIQKIHDCLTLEVAVGDDDDELSCVSCGEDVNVFHEKDGNAYGFSKSWRDGNSHYSFSYFSDDKDKLSSVANDLNVKL